MKDRAFNITMMLPQHPRSIIQLNNTQETTGTQSRLTTTTVTDNGKQATQLEYIEGAKPLQHDIFNNPEHVGIALNMQNPLKKSSHIKISNTRGKVFFLP